MDCRQFDRAVADLHRISNTTISERALDHARNCPLCRARLAEERKLTAALRALSISEANEQAPERVEQALVSAFRARWEKPKSVAALGAALPRHGGVKAWTLWAGVATALLLTFFLAWKRQPAKVRMQPDDRTSASRKPKEILARAAVDESRQSGAASRAASGRARRPARRVTRPQGFETPGGAVETEVTTRFYPLPYGSGLGLDEGWALVRVRVPRSSLALLGMPVGANSAGGQMLTADVVVGQDGLARGIRFVQ